MRTLLLLLSLLAAVPAQARLSPEERAMAAAVDRESVRSITLLERLVDRNSGSLNLEGVTAIGGMIRAELEPLGFQVRWVDMRETGRAGHIVATHAGRGRNVLLIGHLDTVFEPESPFQSFVREGNRATGPGIGDDKGGLVVIVAALRAMHQAGTLRDANVTIVLTGDEERPGAPIAIARRDPDQLRAVLAAYERMRARPLIARVRCDLGRMTGSEADTATGLKILRELGDEVQLQRYGG